MPQHNYVWTLTAGKRTLNYRSVSKLIGWTVLSWRKKWDESPSLATLNGPTFNHLWIFFTIQEIYCKYDADELITHFDLWLKADGYQRFGNIQAPSTLPPRLTATASLRHKARSLNEEAAEIDNVKNCMSTLHQSCQTIHIILLFPCWVVGYIGNLRQTNDGVLSICRCIKFTKFGSLRHCRKITVFDFFFSGVWRHLIFVFCFLLLSSLISFRQQQTLYVYCYTQLFTTTDTDKQNFYYRFLSNKKKREITTYVLRLLKTHKVV